MSNDIVLELNPSADNPRNSEGAFIDLADGRIMFAYSRFYGGGADCAPAHVMARFSADGGRSWSEKDVMLVQNPGQKEDQNVMSVSLLRMQDGAIGLFYVQRNARTDARARLIRSYDEGLTWSPPTLVVSAPGYFVLNNDRVVRLSSGRLVAPVSQHRMKAEPRNLTDYSCFDGRGLIMFYLSDDDGVTWRESADWWSTQQMRAALLQEPGVVELKDGRLWAWCRSNGGQQWSLFSTDGGEHWTAPTTTTLLSPCSPASIKRIPKTGDLLLVWNDHNRCQGWDSNYVDEPPVLNPQAGTGSRNPLVVALSNDEGQTWQRRRCLENSPRHGFCYTAIHFLDNAVLLAYCAGGSETNGLLNRLRLRRLSLDWLYSS